MAEEGLRSITVSLPAASQSRDKGKVFHISEMDSARAEKWGWRMILLLRSSGERIPDNVKGLGIVGVAILGLNIWLRGQIKYEELEPLLDEMFSCVQIIRDRKNPHIVTPLLPEDILDVSTRVWLRGEVLSLHTGFSFKDAASQLISAIQGAASQDSSGTTQTSPPPSASPSPAGASGPPTSGA